ncbi:MAG: hypothetical protein Q8K59_08140 [Nitrosomonas sp.]|nr:hypothetical protein [Nitrosomonas sp.]MDP1951046.1 hypothetical protein [Nitrosomonas sp.]
MADDFSKLKPSPGSAARKEIPIQTISLQRATGHSTVSKKPGCRTLHQ